IFVALFTTFVALVAPVHAQSWPQKPVKLLVPFGAGGNTDAIARIIAQHLGDAFGEPFVVENRPGAAGALATEAVPRPPPARPPPTARRCSCRRRRKSRSRRRSARHGPIPPRTSPRSALSAPIRRCWRYTRACR